LGIRLLLSFVAPRLAAAVSACERTYCRTGGRARARIAANRTTNGSDGRTARRPSNCLTLRLRL
jgi:hypothetical protein